MYFWGRVFKGMVGNWVNTKSPPIPKLSGDENTREVNKALRYSGERSLTCELLCYARDLLSMAECISNDAPQCPRPLPLKV